MLLLVLVGCGQTDADGDCVNDGFPKSGYVCGSEEDDTISEDNPIADVTWTSDAIELTITGGLGYNFEFGLVQNDDDCVFARDAEEGDTICWEDEACLETTGSALCHPAGSSGVRLDYTPDGLSGEADINAGDNTGFPGRGYEYRVTYYLYDTVSEACWVWGLDTTYFTDQNFGCAEAN